MFFFFSSRRRHTRSLCDWSSDVCSSDLFATVCFANMGFTGLPRSHVGEADGCKPDGTLAARRCDSGDVPQQEAGGLSALSSGGFEFAASDFVAGHLPGAKGLSKPRDPGPLYALQDQQI